MEKVFALSDTEAAVLRATGLFVVLFLLVYIAEFLTSPSLPYCSEGVVDVGETCSYTATLVREEESWVCRCPKEGGE